MSKETISVPDLGGAEGVDVIEICVAVGDQVEIEDSLVVLESDKASMEVPSPVAGTVTAITIADGDTLSEGDAILELETAGAAAQASVEEVKQPAQSEAVVESAPEPESKPKAATDIAPQLSTQAINIPDLGGAESAEVIEVCVSAGDEVSEGDSLIVLETDKASMEVPSPSSGKVISVTMSEGDAAAEGAEILQLQVAVENNSAVPDETEQEVAPPTEVASGASKPPITVPAEKTQEPVKTGSGIYAGPAVRLLARELGVDIHQVKGTGPRGRISKDDLKGHVKAVVTDKSSASKGSGIPQVPAVDYSKFGPVTTEPLSKISKLTAENMHRSWLNVPHVTQFDDADITELEDFRQGLKAEAERRGVKITPLPFILKACAAALLEEPKFNASLHADGEQIVYKQYVNIGMAVDTPAGLMVPVIRDVDKKSVWELAAETAELAQKAKERKLKPVDMQGGCFTISSLGSIGGQGFTPIVNTPEVAILGVSKLAVKPVWDGSEFVPRKMLPLSLSYDHRVINGADGGRFFTYLAAVLADIRRLVL